MYDNAPDSHLVPALVSVGHMLRCVTIMYGTSVTSGKVSETKSSIYEINMSNKLKI